MNSTGYVTGKCSHCGLRIVTETSNALASHGAQVIVRCPTVGCEGSKWHGAMGGGVYCKRIKGMVSDKECGPRCTEATGPNCECTCGGDRHGMGHLV
jgi:hypothetical protein